MESIIKYNIASYLLINGQFNNLPAHFQETNTLEIAIAFGK